MNQEKTTGEALSRAQGEDPEQTTVENLNPLPEESLSPESGGSAKRAPVRKKNQPLRRLNAVLTGMLFAAYAAYNVFIIFRNGSSISSEGVLISATVALLFTVLACFAWTAGLKLKRKSRTARFQMIRRTAFIIAFLSIFALKLRMIGQVIGYLDYARAIAETDGDKYLIAILYAFTYFMTLTAMLILNVYYIFIRKRLLLFPKVSAIIPTFAAILFLICLILEAILFFALGINLEASSLRTVVMRPVFYLGFIGLCLYFLFPPHPTRLIKKKKPINETNKDNNKENDIEDTENDIENDLI